MHKYMRAIGFSKKLSRTEQEALFKLILKSPDGVEVWNKPDGTCLSEVEKDIAFNIGICLRGEGIPGDDFVPEYFFPYIKSLDMKTFADISVERHAEKESYAGVCEDEDMHLSIIFYLQNAFQYMDYLSGPHYEPSSHTVCFSGMCVSGKILFPVCENMKMDNVAISRVKSEMMEQARSGDEKAAEAMALDNINEYQQLSRRVMKEDVYSIVDQAFIPYGVECDNYMIIGEIKGMTSLENFVTKEKIWVLSVKCRSFLLEICINHKDLMGEPAVGRRFKGEIWLQGSILIDY